MKLTKKFREKGGHTMANKKTDNKTKTDEKSNAEKKEYSFDGMEDVSKIWMKQQKDLFNQMNKAIEAQQKQYKEIGEIWSTFNTNSYKNPNNAIGDDDYRELANLWKEQYTKINANLQETTRRSINQYTELFDKWRVLTEIMNKVASSQGEAQKKHLQDLATKYEDLSKYTQDLFDKDNAAQTREYSSIQSTWVEFTKRMNEILARQATKKN